MLSISYWGKNPTCCHVTSQSSALISSKYNCCYSGISTVHFSSYPCSTALGKYYMEVSRNKQFVSFKMHQFEGMMKYLESHSTLAGTGIIPQLSISLVTYQLYHKYWKKTICYYSVLSTVSGNRWGVLEHIPSDERNDYINLNKGMFPRESDNHWASLLGNKV